MRPSSAKLDLRSIPWPFRAQPPPTRNSLPPTVLENKSLVSGPRHHLNTQPVHPVCLLQSIILASAHHRVQDLYLTRCQITCLLTDLSIYLLTFRYCPMSAYAPFRFRQSVLSLNGTTTSNLNRHSVVTSVCLTQFCSAVGCANHEKYIQYYFCHLLAS